MNVFAAEITTIIFLLSAFMTVSLAVTAYREAERGRERSVLIPMLSVYALAACTAAVDSFLYAVFGLAGPERHLFLCRVQISLMLVFHGTLMHFVSLHFTSLADVSGKRIWQFVWRCVWPGAVYVSVAGFVAYFWSDTRFAFQGAGNGKGIVCLDRSLSLWFRLLIASHWSTWLVAAARIGDEARPYSLKSGLVSLGLGPDIRQPWSQAKKLSQFYENQWNSWIALLAYMLWTLILALNLFREPGKMVFYWIVTPVVFLPILVYFKMKAVFLDVVVKRTVLTAFLMVVTALYFSLLVFPSERAVAGTEPRGAPLVVYLAAVGISAAWPSIRSQGSTLIDTFLYRRPNYDTILNTLSEDLKWSAEPEAATAVLLTTIQKALGVPAQLVTGDGAEGAADTLTEPALTVRLSAGERDFGELRLGPRQGSRRYQSEDLRFVQAAVQQLTGTLESLALQKEREEQQRREAELRALAVQAELRALRAQINPHFLFNTLNSVAQLTAEDPAAAETALLNLSGVFRYVLEAAERDLVTLGEEVDFVRAYLAVEQIRFEDRLRVDIRLPEDLRETAVPPMLIQPLVENSLKHAIAGRAAGGAVSIDAEAIDRDVKITVRDDGPGFDTGNLPALGRTRAGAETRRPLGLENVRARLERLYGSGRMLVKSKPGQGTEVILLIPMQEPGQDSSKTEVEG